LASVTIIVMGSQVGLPALATLSLTADATGACFSALLRRSPQPNHAG